MQRLRFSHLYAMQRRRVLRYLNQDENGGTTTIEFVLWLPIFILILSLIIDVCLLFLAQAIMFDVASDVARKAATGRYASDADAQTDAATRASFRGTSPTVAVTGIDTLGGTVSVTITHDPRNIDITGVLNFIAGDSIEAVVTQLREGS